MSRYTRRQLANFSLPFSSVIAIDRGSSFLKAAAVTLAESVAPKALSPILTVILLIDLSVAAERGDNRRGPAKPGTSVKMSEVTKAYWTISTLRWHVRAQT